jgi:hypothetical protein
MTSTSRGKNTSGWASEVRAALFPLLLAACSGCRASLPSSSQTAFKPAILRDSLPQGKLAITACAENNVPYIVHDYSTQGTAAEEGIRVHELDHVRFALATPGGCRRFVARYRTDSAFKIQVELEAYCAQGRWLVERNHDPQEVWEGIERTLRVLYGARDVKNCLYSGER